jgi:hypothetical protein
MEENGHLQLAEVCSNAEPEASSERHEVSWSTVYLRFILSMSTIKNNFTRYMSIHAVLLITWAPSTNLEPRRVKSKGIWVDVWVQMNCWRADHHSPSRWNCVPCHQCLSRVEMAFRFCSSWSERTSGCIICQMISHVQNFCWNR